MDDQDNTPQTPGPFAHLSRHSKMSEQELRIAAFNDRQRRSGSKKRWHDFYPEQAANDPAKE